MADGTLQASLGTRNVIQFGNLDLHKETEHQKWNKWQ